MNKGKYRVSYFCEGAMHYEWFKKKEKAEARADELNQRDDVGCVEITFFSADDVYVSERVTQTGVNI